jgi:hypothetical protein
MPRRAHGGEGTLHFAAHHGIAATQSRPHRKQGGGEAPRFGRSVALVENSAALADVFHALDKLLGMHSQQPVLFRWKCRQLDKRRLAQWFQTKVQIEVLKRIWRSNQPGIARGFENRANSIRPLGMVRPGVVFNEKGTGAESNHSISLSREWY